MNPSAAAEPHYVYRHWDQCGRLLYVGCTMDPKSRPYSRRRWSDEVARIDVSDAYPGWESGRRAEDVAIHEERPLYNLAYNRTGLWGYYQRPSREEWEARKAAAVEAAA